MLIMSRKLSELLGASEPLFSISLQRLEQASGHHSVDVRLTAEIIGKTHQKMRELGLDPKYTNGRELHHALVGLARLHDSFLAKKLGITDHGDVKEVLRAIAASSGNLPVITDTWAIKTSVLRRLLKTVPPKKVMKVLKYRSVDSMLKRESPSELLGGARFVESDDWHSKFLSQYAKLQPSDFENRKIEIIYYDPAKWDDAATDYVHRTRHTVSHLKETGAVLLAPLPVDRMPGLTITTLPLVLHYINEIRTYSAYFKSCQASPEFGEILFKTIQHDPNEHFVMSGHNVHWRVLQRHYGRAGRFSEVFEPHLTGEDMAWQSAEAMLYKIEPALYFWRDMDYVGGFYDGQPVSFNILDVAISAVNNLNYGYQSTSHMRTALWHELMSRYLARPSLERQVIGQLASDTVEVDFSEIIGGEF